MKMSEVIRSSSVEEQAAVNRLAVGSSPTSGAISLEEFCNKVCGDTAPQGHLIDYGIMPPKVYFALGGFFTI